MRSVHVLAHAKVNLSLEVLGKRSDGFHEIKSVVQSVRLADELTISDADDLVVECDIPGLSGDGNLAMTAARALLDRYSRDRGARIAIRKGIPVASGMGGASADAAAALVGLADLWDVSLQPSDLHIIASGLGSDVPFLLSGGTALVTGRGHLVHPIPLSPVLWLLLVVPPHNLEGKTAALYGRLTPEMWSDGERVERLARAIADGLNPSPSLMVNTFEAVAGTVFTSLPVHREIMLAEGCPSVHLTGAGPTLFSVFYNEIEANAVSERLRARGLRSFVTCTIDAGEAAPRTHGDGGVEGDNLA